MLRLLYKYVTICRDIFMGNDAATFICQLKRTHTSSFVVTRRQWFVSPAAVDYIFERQAYNKPATRPEHSNLRFHLPRAFRSTSCMSPSSGITRHRPHLRLRWSGVGPVHLDNGNVSMLSGPSD